jgi:hypothetical protein
MLAQALTPRLGPLVAGLFTASACGGSDVSSEAAQPLFGEETTAVVVVNPIINENSTTTVVPGDVRAGIHVGIADGGPATLTDDTGLAVLVDIPVGELELEIGDGVVLLDVREEGELYDVVVALRDGEAEHIIPPVRYPIGGDIIELRDGDSLEDAIADEVVIFLGPGRYRSNFELRNENVLIFGSWDPVEGPLAVLEDDFPVLGELNRIRSVALEGTLTSRANQLSMSFSYLEGANLTGTGVSLIRNQFADESSTTVPSSDAVLVDNDGIP